MKRIDFLHTTVMGGSIFTILPLLTACNEAATQEVAEKPMQQNATPPQKPKIVKEKDGIKLNVLGDHQNIKLSGKDTNGQYTLIEQNNEPGVGIPPHIHENEDEVFQVLSGQVEMSIGETRTVLKAGDLIFCPKGIPHSWTVIGEENARALLSIFPAGLEDMFVELAALPAGPPDMKKVTAICNKYNLKFV